MRLPKFVLAWLAPYIPVKHILVPTGFDTPTGAMEGQDPYFLTRMSRSFQDCRVVYEDIHNKIKARQASQRTIPPTAPSELEAWKNRQAQIAVELAFAHELMMGPTKAAKALEAIKTARDEEKEQAQAGLETWDLNPKEKEQ